MTTKNPMRRGPKDEMFERYCESFYLHLQGSKDYEALSRGYGEWYHDCLPADKNARILDIGCADGRLHPGPEVTCIKDGFVQRAVEELAPGVDRPGREVDELGEHPVVRPADHRLRHFLFKLREEPLGMSGPLAL